MLIKKIFILLTILGGSTCVFAQSGISTAGSSITNSSIHVDYSIGQVSYTTIPSSTSSITQGILQPHYQIVNINDPIVSVRINLFPNPTNERIEIDAQEQFSKITLLTPEGKTLKEFDGSAKSIDLTSYSEKLFIINIYSNKQKIKTFKIIKN
jgi:hypothetical protein